MSGGKAFERCRVKVMYVLCESETGVERRVSSGNPVVPRRKRKEREMKESKERLGREGEKCEGCGEGERGGAREDIRCTQQ